MSTTGAVRIVREEVKRSVDNHITDNIFHMGSEKKALTWITQSKAKIPPHYFPTPFYRTTTNPTTIIATHPMTLTPIDDALPVNGAIWVPFVVGSTGCHEADAAVPVADVVDTVDKEAELHAAAP